MDNNTLHIEQELFARIAEGDEHAFKQLYIQLKPMLFGFIFKLTKSQDAVTEIVQESLFRLWMSRDKLAEVRHPRSWFFKLVANECHHYFRKHGLQKRLMGELEQRSESADPARERSTEMELSFRETRQLIQEAVQKLAPRQREIFRLSRDHGLTIPEIAAHLGVSEKYVKKTLIHTLGLLRQRLTEAGKYLFLLLLWPVS